MAEDDVIKTATISSDDHARLQIIGIEGDSRLIRIKGGRSAFDFQESTSGAEGEDARDAVFAQDW